ncbi:MAG: alpha/beta hydrolase [Dehalococcoidia bacterium]|nr:alpha/beta hydrolase [Dehalococcoidia bacterium]
MSHETDTSFMDIPEILEIVFPIAYSPLYFPQPSEDPVSSATTHFVEVEGGVRIGCAMWVRGTEFPTILYFHGNGETVADHEWLAQFYLEKGVNLFVADYRGYGLSSGKPTISNLLKDCHPVYDGFRRVINSGGFKDSVFIMGRSLGSMPAVELAYHRQGEVKGLIIESGSANNLHRLWGFLEDSAKEKLSSGTFLNKDKIKTVSIPTCVIHGEYDQILPVQEGIEMYESSGARDKDLLIIQGADHNDLMIRGHKQYFDKIGDFISQYS